MKRINPASSYFFQWIFTRAPRQIAFVGVTATFLLGNLSAQAQTTEYWTSASDNYTNGPVGGDWNPAITGSVTNWPNNFNGSVSSSSGYLVAITNNGICNYAGSPAGDPNYTNTINDLYIGGTGNGSGGGGISNNFVMAGGSLTLVDPNGPSFAIGGTATGGKAGAQSTNYFTMTGGTFMATNAIANANGGCVVGFGTNSVGTVNFNGGTAVLSDLVIGGHGVGVVNINGGNVLVMGTDTNALKGAIDFDTQATGNGTLNILSGTLTLTNGQVSLGEGAIANLISTINMSGGIFNVFHIEFGAGSAAKATNIVNFSGGTINFGSGTARNGTTQTNYFIMSGGTISCLPGNNPNFAGGLTHWMTATAPGPGVVTFAPPVGLSISFPDVSGAGGINFAGPGASIETAGSTYTGNTTVSGGTLSLGTAGSITSPIIIAGNAIFDVSEQASTYALASGQVLSNSTSTAIINGSLNTGSGIVSLLYASGTPAFTVTTNNSVNNTNANLATLTLSATTTFKINNTGPALAIGNYLLISTNNGASIAGTLPGVVTVTGGGIQAGDTASLSTSIDGQLYLVVAALPPPPAIGSYLPVTHTSQFTLYAGASPTFSVLASSPATIYYQWFTNGVGVGWGTNASLTLTNVQSGFLTNYCVASNYAGSTTSIVWTASVIATPAAYPQLVVAANPIGYWRLNEGNDNGNGDDGYIANDYAGGNDGIYTNVTLGNQGYNPTADPSDTSAGFGNLTQNLLYVNNLAGQIQGIDFATGNGTNAEFTVQAWVQGQTGNENANGTVLAEGVFGVNDEFNLGLDTASAQHYRFYVRNALGTIYTADSSFVPDSNWHYLVGVCDEVNGAVSLYIDGALAASVAIPASSGEYEANAPMSIGSGITNNSPNGYTLQFNGNVNDVAAFNYALSANQVANQYVHALNVPPYFIQPPPASITVNAGGTLTLSPVTAAGTLPPLGYQWFDVNGNPIAGAEGVTNTLPLNASLTYNNVPLSWNHHQVELVVSNAYGMTNVYVTLTVAGAPIIQTNIPPQVTLGLGQSYNYVLGVAASSVVQLYYLWLTNGVPDTTAGTTATYALASVQSGQSGETYQCIITNIYGAATSTLSTLTVLPPIGSFPYATNILGLNPVGYWPMHEVETGAPGDIETNYGSIGVLGNGYYGDWIGLAGIIHTNPGALANDPDTSVEFAYSGTANTGDPTNSLIIPHTSPLSTLNPPFTVECWANMHGQGGDLWAQEGGAGLDNGPNFAGIRCYAHSGAFSLYCDNGANGSANFDGGTISGYSQGVWYHVVVVDDGTNINEYLDGILAATNLNANYAPDYWSPLSIGSGRGFSRSVNCTVDEFAVYTNALATNDIIQHYNDGINESQAGVYVADVMNDHPVIYLRMDSPPYTSPGFLPDVVNYGSVGVNGVYSVGTLPGAVSGSSYPGFPIGGLSGTNIPALSGVNSWADVGYAAAYNPIGATPFSVTALFRGNPTDARAQTIVGHNTSSWRLWMSASGNLEWQIGGTTLTSAGIYNDGDWHQIVAVYSPASTPGVTGTNLLYVDGVLDSSVSTVSTNGIAGGSTSDVMIGADSQYTNNPEVFGQQFAGQICEVALFTNAVTASQVQALYNSYGVRPFIDGQPITGRGVGSGAGTYIYFGVDAGGTPSLGYKWYFNSNPAYTGATQLSDNTHYSLTATPQITVTNLTPVDSGYYFVIVTNNYGSVTSILASLVVTNSVNLNPTNIVAFVANNQLTLTWPPDHTGWELQAQTNRVSTGLGANWVPVAGSTNVNQEVMPINPANGCVFYRLVYPPQ